MDLDIEDLKMLSEALTQYVDNDAEPAELRAENGEPTPESVTRAHSMLGVIDARLVAALA